MTGTINNVGADLVAYQSEDGKLSFNVNIFDETVWLSQKQMSDLFQRDRTVISRHINSIFKEGELNKKVVCAEFAHTTRHGAITGKKQQSKLKYYNLDVIISVGYRVKSHRGTQFRQWATHILKQYMINGYAINEHRVRSILEEYISELKLEFKDDIRMVYEKMSDMANKPVNIYNHINLMSNDLEDKLIRLLDQIIDDVKENEEVKTQLEAVKKDISALPKTPQSKNRLIRFLKDVGDSKSDIHKTIKGAGIAKNVMSEFVKICAKFKDFL